ncbi:MAG: hypothetical protein NUV74_13540 [Candidatus Brocadiaceae bacterium]|nr:hypothetical protein [Candidatus Brocadiaceae bacterium]
MSNFKCKFSQQRDIPFTTASGGQMVVPLSEGDTGGGGNFEIPVHKYRTVVSLCLTVVKISPVKIFRYLTPVSSLGTIINEFFQTSQKIKTRTAAEIIPGNDKGVII